jgi:hypothetical protein
MKFLIIGLTSVFLFSCGQNGELSNTKEDVSTMKLSKEHGHKHRTHGHNGTKQQKHFRTQGIDAETTTTYKDNAASEATSTTTAPRFDTGLRPSNSK